MATINVIKEQRQTDTPLLLFTCTLPSGDVERWSTHQVIFEGALYSARVVHHNLFDLQLSADDAMDGISKLTLTLANADSQLSELNAAISMKGSQIAVYFAFADLRAAVVSTESTVLFRGIAGDPDEITESVFVLSFVNKLSLQRIPVPDVRIQRSCAWNFPSTNQQRTQARDGGVDGLTSRYYRCGYSADLPGGVGNLLAGEPYVSCDKSRVQCEARGMFNKDGNGNITCRYGGFEFVPSAINVRTAGDKSTHVSPLLTNSAQYNDSVPIVYGTGWLRTPITFTRNDGNLTHMEVLVGMGPITGILKVVVNDVEIPQAVPSQDMTATGWYALVNPGNRNGVFNSDFQDQNGPLGDPHGSMATLSVVVPNRISTGVSLPTIEVLLQGVQISTYDATATVNTIQYSNNPAWVILDLLHRCGWPLSDLNLQSFVASASFCDFLINTSDLNGNEIQVPRFQCNLVITKRQSAASIVRGIRVASSLMLRYGSDGLLELLPETTLAAQQPTPPDGSNSTQILDAGYPAYEFSDASDVYSGILRNSDGSSSVRLSSRSIAECSNRLSVEFQDATNEYQQDSLSLVDPNDSELIGYEISSQSTALGISNFSQATRVLLRQLDKLTKGNLYVEFQTSFRALKIRPGDIIALTYLKEGFERTTFRVVRLSPSTNYETVTILAQLHNDDWYSDDPAILGGNGRQPGFGGSSPRPLIGVVKRVDANGTFEIFDFGISEQIQANKDGTTTDTIAVSFSQPTQLNITGTSIPLVSLSPHIDVTGGSLLGGVTYYYAVSALNSAGEEGPLSFTVAAKVPVGSNTNTVSIVNLSFPQSASTFNVFRGLSPQSLYCIAQSSPLQSSFIDSGYPSLAIGPPDPNFDHANFYYRYEYLGPIQVSSADRNSVTNQDLGATPSAYIGMTVRISEGAGRGQERSIVGNTATSVVVLTPWTTIPDVTSSFVICEPAWHFAAVSKTSPVQFEIPYREGAVVQVTGRSASVHNVEGSPELCPITRLALGQQKPDFGIPATPSFSLDAPGGGLLTLSQVGFSDLNSISSVSSGTLRLYYWNELATPSSATLASFDPISSIVNVNANLFTTPPDLTKPNILQIGAELMLINSVDPASNSLSVVRAVLGSLPGQHNNGDSILVLSSAVVSTSFAPGFFENRASVNFVHSFSLPDARVTAAEFFVTNSFGDSEVQTVCYTSTPERGLRTLSGGQVSMQVSGFLSTQLNATPAILVDHSHAVRDLRASLGQAATGYQTIIDVLQNSNQYCRLVIQPGQTSSMPGGGSSEVFDGVGLPPLVEGSDLTTNITSVLSSDGSSNPIPGRDLTVTIRF